MIRRAAHIFAPLRVDRQPWITRQSYLHERTASLTLPVALGLMEGSVVGVLARLTFRIPDLYIAILVASPMFANLTSFIWARLARGRPKVPLINLMQAGLLLCVGAVAFLPTPPALTGSSAADGPIPTDSLTLGQGLLVALVITARCLWAGVVTLRSTVWRQNYPRHVRAQVTGRLALLFALVTGIAAYVGFSAFDAAPGLFRVVYPLAMVIGILGVWSFSKVRLRRERELLEYERLPASRPTPHGDPAPIYEYDPANATTNPPTTRDNFWTVLRRDPLYRSYMLWQFVAGSANLMTETVIIFLVTDLLAGMHGQYQVSVALTTVIPQLIAVATLPIWAKWMDRVHIAEFRARQGWVWVFNQSSLWAAAMIGAWTGSPGITLALLILPRIGQGVARGAGMLAWNLGHNDFADRRLVSLYMGIHVTLTGIRGAAAPLLAVFLWSGWNDVDLWGVVPRDLAGSFPGIGPHLFLFTTALALAAERGFKALHRRVEAGKTDLAADER